MCPTERPHGRVRLSVDHQGCHHKGPNTEKASHSESNPTATTHKEARYSRSATTASSTEAKPACRSCCAKQETIDCRAWFSIETGRLSHASAAKQSSTKATSTYSTRASQQGPTEAPSSAATIPSTSSNGILRQAHRAGCHRQQRANGAHCAGKWPGIHGHLCLLAQRQSGEEEDVQEEPEEGQKLSLQAREEEVERSLSTYGSLTSLAFHIVVGFSALVNKV
jgi:hypothetical protein